MRNLTGTTTAARGVAAVCLPVLLLTACATTSQNPAGDTSRRIARYQEHRQHQRWRDALDVMRREIEDPAHTNDRFLADIRIITLEAMAYHAQYLGADDALDDEALRYHREGRKFAHRDQRRQALLEHNASVYFLNSLKPGTAEPYVRRELTLWQELGDRFQEMLAYNSMAHLYREMGEAELLEKHRTLAIDLGRHHFGQGSSEKNPEKWKAWFEVLGQRMDDLAQQGRASEVEELWKIQASVVRRRMGTPRFPAYGLAAVRLALAGEVPRARAVLDEMADVARADGQEWARTYRGDLPCYRGQVDVAAAEYAEGARRLSKCIAGMEDGGFAPAAALYRALGVALENSGDFDGAIKSYQEAVSKGDRSRSNLSVADRSAFFRSAVRVSYWGLARTYARRHQATHRPEDFQEALRAAERIRARQLGDILDGRASAEQSRALDGLRALLAPDQLVLSYLQTDTELLIMAFTADEQRVVLVPRGQAAMRALAEAASQALSDPTTPMPTVDAALDAMSAAILLPVQDMVASRARMVVVPDGMVGIIPVDALRLPGGRPLVMDKTLWMAPTLTFLARASPAPAGRSATRVLAVADPRYAGSRQVGPLTTDEMRGMTRGSRFLSYFSPLPETRSEVESIGRLFPAGSAQFLLGERAVESGVKALDLRQFSHVHFATHGILGGEVPGVREPALVLGDEPGEDGFLTGTEVSALRMDADLAVLSACNTGTGVYVTGEGVVGMSRAFLAAGSRSVVMSLWSVDSAATERLMVAFYTHLRQGKPAPVALRQAKLDLMAGGLGAVPAAAERGLALRSTAAPAPSTSLHPYYWSSFVVAGR